jgi:amidase
MSAFDEFEAYDGVGLARLIADGDVSARDVVAAAIERIERINPSINAVVTKTYNRAMALIESGVPGGPFGGVPFLLKDLSADWRGVPSTEGSRSTRWYVPERSSTLVSRYEAAGLVILGKTNTPEFGLLPVTEPELHGITSNPWDPSRTAGGSSGGAAAAVAAGMVPAAHASDGGGSIRIPASNCGLFGLKPTRARTPAGPIVGESWFGMSVAHVVSRSVRDSAALLDVERGPEVGDPYAAPEPERPYVEEVGADPGRLRVGVVDGAILGERTDPECRAAVRSAAELMHGLGHRVEGVELPIDRDRLNLSFLTMVAAALSQVVDWAASIQGLSKPDHTQYELSTWVTSLAGRKLSAVDLADAIQATRVASRVIGRIMCQYDVIMSSTLGSPPMVHGALQPTETERRLLEGLRRAPARPAIIAAFRQLAKKVIEPIPNTPLFNMTGQPAMTVPLHWTDRGLPVGVQFAGRFGDEATLFRLAAQLETARPWFHRRPALVAR